MGNSTKKQVQKRGRDIRCLSAGGASWDGPRDEQLFVRNFPSAVDFFASFFHQGKKEGLAGEANDKVVRQFHISARDLLGAFLIIKWYKWVPAPRSSQGQASRE